MNSALVRPITLIPAAIMAVYALLHLCYGHTPLSYDEVRYTAMARHLPMGEYPYSYRVLVPWLVSVLPLPTDNAFLAVSLLASTVAGIALWAFIKGFGFTERSAFFGSMLYCTSYAVTFNLYHFRLVDPALLAMSTLCFVWIQRQKDGLLAWTLAAGSLCKESILFVIPCALWFAWKQPGRLRPTHSLLRRMAAVTPCILLFWGARAEHWFGWHTSNYTWKQIAAVIGYQLLTYGSVWMAVAVAMAASFGALWAAVVVGWLNAPAKLRPFACYFPCVAVQLVLGGDWIRMLSIALPVAIPFALCGLSRLQPLTVCLLAVADAAMVAAFIVPQHMAALYLPFHITAIAVTLRFARRSARAV